MKRRQGPGPGIRLVVVAAMLLGAAFRSFGADGGGQTPPQTDPILELFIKKGFVTEEEAKRVQAEAEAVRAARMSNAVAEAMPPLESKWKISNAIKSVELFGDLRLRYESREAKTPGGLKLELDRWRYEARIGLRGDVFDNFYYGFRLDTAPNPRSPWVTFGTSTTGVPYQGPDGKSGASLDIGQVYVGWRPTSWLDITVGKMPNPLYTTAMVWDTDLNPEGAAERFKYTVGQAELFATFGQFLYADFNPNSASGGLGVGINPLVGQETDNIFMFAWQAGVNYHFSTDISAKIAATLYNYIGLNTNLPPYFGDAYVGEGSYLGPGTGTIEGSSGYNPGAGATTPGFYAGFPNNQTGIRNLLILDIPMEVDFKIKKLDARIFGDVAYNLEGGRRAEEAAAAYGNYLSANSATISAFAPQKNENKAYQVGFALGSEKTLGMVYGSTVKKYGWEFRTYWQHVEQYALDPNLMDSDFFEGRGNLEGIYGAFAFGFSQNVIGTIRYGHASRINDLLGTGGSNQDIPQINPIKTYELLQLDLTLKF
jgi:hypothetical protein